MKYNTFFVAILFSLFISVSCSEDFLDRNSLIELSEGSLWQSENDAVLAVNALYDINREFINSIVIYGMMDDFTDISYQSWATGLTTGSFPTNAAFYSNAWGAFYKGINRANKVLENVPDIPMDTEVKNRLLGEAKFFRGYYYFKLWNYFGGVPLYTQSMGVDEAYKPRNSEEEVYQLIVSDMSDAYNLLPESYDQSSLGRATKWAALSMRGKAHLWAKQYAEAASDFKEVIEQSDRELIDDFSLLFQIEGNNNREVIFDVQYVAEDGYGIATDLNYGNAMGSTPGSQRTRPTPHLVNAFEMLDGSAFDFSRFTNAEGAPFDPDNPEDWNDEDAVRQLFENRDPRLHQSIVVPWASFHGRGGKDYLYKFPVDDSDPDAYVPIWQNGSYAWRKFVPRGSSHTLARNVPVNIPIIRLADVYLMYAEAQNFYNGPDDSVYEAVNKVRQRAGMPDLPGGLNEEEMFEKIQHERMVELAGEGQRYDDLRRWMLAREKIDGVWMKTFTGVNIRQRGFPENFYLWPIPQVEIDINPDLTQNPGWN